MRLPSQKYHQGKMAQPPREGDLVSVTTPSGNFTLTVTEVRPEGVYVYQENGPDRLLNLVNGQWQIANYNQPHTVTFSVNREPFTPETGDEAVLEVLPSTEIAKVKIVAPTRIQLYMFDPTVKRLVQREVESTDGNWEYIPGLPISFANGRTALSAGILHNQPIDGGVARVPIVQHEIRSIGRVTEEDPLMVGETIIEYDGHNWRIFDLEPLHLVHFRMDPEKYISYLKRPADYLRAESPGFNTQSILTTPIVGLIHQTRFRNLREIVNQRQLSIPIKTRTDLVDLNYYPGIYTRLLTQYGLLNYLLQTEHKYGEVQLLISPAIMKQKNWHLKITDPVEIYGYGTITNLTFGPNSLSEYIGRLPVLWGQVDVFDSYLNELVVHDAIPIDFVNMILVRTEAMRRIVYNMLRIAGLENRIAVRIADRRLNEELLTSPPDMREDLPLSTEPPQYCYTGVGGLKVDNFEPLNPYTYTTFRPTTNESEYSWRRRMNNCGFPYDANQDEAERRHMIERRLEELYFEGVERTEVTGEDYPPFKYLPSWYQ